MEDKVILVNENDQEIGSEEKLQAHIDGLLHRALSVLIFNSSGELLLQRRALDKYHSPGLWTNTCCSHPRPEEDTAAAAHRRLNEEMGMNTMLKHSFSFIYRAEFDNSLIEHELDHVFIGISDELPELNPEEAMEYKFVNPDRLIEDIKENPSKYTVWFRIIMLDHFSKISQKLTYESV
ncbi:MAG: isopentenyl-diphosphate Delta-isomerase [Bacteroidetes bacterium]|nr:MAG: isopentenyl-diphosphate Delta-isomerase [Bacteroidota bacterium]